MLQSLWGRSAGEWRPVLQGASPPEVEPSGASVAPGEGVPLRVAAIQSEAGRARQASEAYIPLSRFVASRRSSLAPLQMRRARPWLDCDEVVQPTVRRLELLSPVMTARRATWVSWRHRRMDLRHGDHYPQKKLT